MSGSGSSTPWGLPEASYRVLSERYRLERELSGGMLARVFQAHDLRLQRPVALKLLQPDVGISIGRERFFEEIRLAASLVHPNIVPVHDTGEAQGLLYFTMPFIAGGALRTVLEREHQLGREETVRVTRSVAHALTYAHGRGIVHRDVKPENIMRDTSAVLLTDFGIARLIHPDPDSARTTVGLAIGTPGYMSPEQAAGQRDIDGRSDTYSLACVVYEMLAGEPPFTGPSPRAVMTRHLADTPRPVRAVRASLPAEVDTVLARALAKSPADRFETPDEFAAQLERTLLTPGEQVATIITPPARAPEVQRRMPARWLLLALAVLVGVAALLLARRSTPLDARRVAIFPLSGLDSAAGVGVVTYLGYVLEGTHPLRWENGAEWLQRAAPDDRALRRLARSHGAGLFLDGRVVAGADSTTVVMRLFDVRGDSVLARRGRAGPAGTPVARLAAAATSEILPFVVGGGVAVDVAGLQDRSPAAIANLLQGDVAYDAAKYEDAAAFYLRAAQDTGFVLPRIRAAQALTWLDRQEVVESLTVMAVAGEDRLPPRYRPFARALLDRTQGRADSALAQLAIAIAADSAWPEAWMLLGEVHHHLLRDEPNPDSIADAAFRRARQVGDHFQPPLYHLAEFAIGRGDLRAAEAMMDTLARGGADTLVVRPLRLMLACARGAMNAAGWEAELSHGSVDVLEAARGLAANPNYLGCAEDGFRAVAEWDSISPRQQFGAYQGLDGVLLAQGASDRLRQALDSERGRAASAHYLYVFNAAAGLGFDDEAAQVVEEIEARTPPLSSSAHWLLAVWYASRGDAVRARAHADTLAARSAGGDPTVSLLAAIAAAHAELAEGDTTVTIIALQALRSPARQRELAWTPWDALALERLLLARLLMQRGDYEAVLRVGSTFDSTAPIMFIGLRPAALALRADAAERLARRRLASHYRERLAAFGAGAPAPAVGGGRT